MTGDDSGSAGWGENPFEQGRGWNDGRAREETAKTAQPPAPLVIIDPGVWQDQPVPRQRWLVPEWIPWARVTGLYGPGGQGKTTLLQQLMTASALIQPWIGQRVFAAKSFGVFCEDDEEEMHRRQAAINALYQCRFTDLTPMMRCLPRLGDDNLLMTFEPNGRGVLTPFWHQLRDEAKDFGAQLIIIDNIAATFGGNENDRSQVTQYGQVALGGLARDLDGILVAAGHPSLTGMASGGSGSSGSTGWPAVFRSHAYLESPEPEEGEAPDPYVRILSRKKANYAVRDEAIRLRWKDGVFIAPDHHGGIFGTIERRHCERVFLDLLDATTAENQPVSHNNKSGNYAPKLFAMRPDREGYKKADFERAMQALFARKEIMNVQYGRSADLRYRIARAANGVIGDTTQAANG
jgi:RecA-family ATPase